MRRAPGRPHANGRGLFLWWAAHGFARARRARGLLPRRHLRRPPRRAGMRGAPHHAWSWVKSSRGAFLRPGGPAEHRTCRTIIVSASIVSASIVSARSAERSAAIGQPATRKHACSGRIFVPETRSGAGYLKNWPPDELSRG